MTAQELIAPTVAALTAHYATNKLLLLHPNSRNRNLIIASLIYEPPCPVYYYGLRNEDTSLPQLLAGLSRDLSDQTAMFGKHINEAINPASGVNRSGDYDYDYDMLAKALSRDLSELDKKDYLLILDEYDRADEVAEVQTFVEHVLEHLPDQCHLLINSRTLPHLPWMALIAKRQAVVLRDAQMLASGFYSEHFSENPNVEAYALGTGTIMLNGQHVSGWEGALPRLMFFFALDRPMCTRGDICHAFWPELPIDQAVNVFHVSKRRLHKALGFDVILHENGHYHVSPALNLQYDVLEFVNSLVEARSRQGKDADSHWQHAIDLYRGHYLHGYDDEWIAVRRSDFREGYVEALTELAKIREAQKRVDVALGLHIRAMNEAYNREDIHRDIIRLYGRLGRRSEAVEHFQKLETDFKEKYGISPSRETVAVYNEVVKG